jgi:hypothetical protein
MIDDTSESESPSESPSSHGAKLDPASGRDIPRGTDEHADDDTGTPSNASPHARERDAEPRERRSADETGR